MNICWLYFSYALTMQA